MIWAWIADAQWELTAALKNQHLHRWAKGHGKFWSEVRLYCSKCQRTEDRVLRAWCMMIALLGQQVQSAQQGEN